MSEGRSGGTSLDELLIERLGEETYAFYRRTLDNHYWQWKYHRVCDQGSLQDLRLILYESGAATLLPHAAWRIDRSAEEYSNHLGLSQKGEIGYYQELFSGLENPLEPRVLLDSGPGNCTALYQMARPGWTMSGMGDALLFSIEGTLNN